MIHMFSVLLIEYSEMLGLWVSSDKTNVQAFIDILDAAVLSVSVSGDDVEVKEIFTYLGSDLLFSAGSEPEVNRRLSRACGVMDSAGTCAGGRKSESSGPWCFQSCSVDVRLGL